MLFALEPNKHIIYHSQAEAAADEFWWSPGHLTGSKVGDGFCIAVCVVAAIIAWCLIHDHYKSSRVWGKLPLGKLLLSYAIASSGSLFALYLLYFFIVE